MIAVVFGIGVVALAGLVLVVLGIFGMRQPSNGATRIAAERYGSMRRREAQQLKHDMRRDAMRARRELFNELRSEPEQ